MSTVFVGPALPTQISLDEGVDTVELWVASGAPPAPIRPPIFISQYDSMF